MLISNGNLCRYDFLPICATSLPPIFFCRLVRTSLRPPLHSLSITLKWINVNWTFHIQSNVKFSSKIVPTQEQCWINDDSKSKMAFRSISFLISNSAHIPVHANENRVWNFEVDTQCLNFICSLDLFAQMFWHFFFHLPRNRCVTRNFPLRHFGS